MKVYVLYVVDEGGDTALGVFFSKAAAWKAWDKTQPALTYRIEEWEIDDKLDYEDDMFYYFYYD